LSDKIDSLFGDLQPVRDYPGKRRPIGRDQPKKARSGPQELAAWDDHPRKLMFNGVETEFFTIRHVALALDRSTRTIRTWERREVIPPATFRASPPIKGSVVKQTGDRLWTRAQVEAMVRVAREERVLDGLPPGPQFTAKLVQAFLALQQQTNRNTTKGTPW
jgi:DNA-binding transcriptional MerR regulator